VVAGILTSLTPKFDVSLVYRKFDKNFYSFYSNAVAENSIPQNESGCIGDGSILLIKIFNDRLF